MHKKENFMEPQNPYKILSQDSQPSEQPQEKQPEHRDTQGSVARVVNPYDQSVSKLSTANPSTQSASQPTAVNSHAPQQCHPIAETNRDAFAPDSHYPQSDLSPLSVSQTGIQSTTKPGILQVISVLDIINGLVNAVWGLLLFFGGITFILGIYAWVVATMSIIHAVRLSANPPRVTTPNKALAILQIVNFITGNLLSVVIGIVNLIIYERPEVRAFYKQLSRAQLWHDHNT
jgi:hypothetical protein